MSCSKVKPRRHSLPSLESVKQEGTGGTTSSCSATTSERGRKRPLKVCEMAAGPSKKPAFSVNGLVGDLQGAVGREELQLPGDTLCCLPGGV